MKNLILALDSNGKNISLNDRIVIKGKVELGDYPDEDLYNIDAVYRLVANPIYGITCVNEEVESDKFYLYKILNSVPNDSGLLYPLSTVTVTVDKSYEHILYQDTPLNVLLNKILGDVHTDKDMREFLLLYDTIAIQDMYVASESTPDIITTVMDTIILKNDDTKKLIAYLKEIV